MAPGHTGTRLDKDGEFLEHFTNIIVFCPKLNNSHENSTDTTLLDEMSVKITNQQLLAIAQKVGYDFECGLSKTHINLCLLLH